MPYPAKHSRLGGPGQPTLPMDPTSNLYGPKMVACNDCGQMLPGNLGLQVIRPLGDQGITVLAIVHVECHNVHPDTLH
jgi:hypothetical protein